MFVRDRKVDDIVRIYHWSFGFVAGLQMCLWKRRKDFLIEFMNIFELSFGWFKFFILWFKIKFSNKIIEFLKTLLFYHKTVGQKLSLYFATIFNHSKESSNF